MQGMGWARLVGSLTGHKDKIGQLQNLKSHVTLAACGVVYRIDLRAINFHTKFEISIFIRSRDNKSNAYLQIRITGYGLRTNERNSVALSRSASLKYAHTR